MLNMRLALLVGVMLASSRFCAAQAQWPQFLGPNRDGVYEGAVIAKWPDTGPPILWSKDVGAGFAGPVVTGGKLVLFHRVENNERVECMDAKTGKTLWISDDTTNYHDSFGFDEGPRGTPAIVGGKIYTFGAEGHLNCWDVATGKKIWGIAARDQFHGDAGYFGMACSPLVEGNAVIVNVGGKGAGIVAFNKETGAVLWKATDDEAGYASPIAATFGGKRYILDLTRAGLVALDPPTGKVYFQYHFRSRTRESVNAATPLVMGNEIFISASYETGAALLRFEEAGPAKIWAGDNILSNHYATSVYAGGFLFGFDGRQESGPNLRCVELKTGKVRWSEDGFGGGTILSAAGQLVIVTEKGELILAPATADGFKPTARARILPFEVRAYPAVADGLLYARSKDKLVCVDIRP